MAFGMDGPINEHWGLGWREVCNILIPFDAETDDEFCRAGIYIKSNNIVEVVLAVVIKRRSFWGVIITRTGCLYLSPKMLRSCPLH